MLIAQAQTCAYSCFVLVNVTCFKCFNIDCFDHIDCRLNMQLHVVKTFSLKKQQKNFKLLEVVTY